jgi:hypothetical protein
MENEDDSPLGYSISTLMMEAVCTSKTSVYFKTTRRYIPEDSHLHTRRRENLKSAKRIFSQK